MYNNIDSAMFYIRANLVDDLEWTYSGRGLIVVSVTSAKLKKISLQVGPALQIDNLSDSLIKARIFNTLGLSFDRPKEKKEKPVAQLFDDVQMEKSRLAGERTAKTLLPFLRTDVPGSSIFDLAMLVSFWCGFPNDGNFSSGFVNVFQQYQEVNKNRQITARKTLDEQA